MVNKELLDYISQQIKLGISKETIKASLMSQNWSEQDVSEGFAAFEKPNVVPPLPISVSSSVLPNISEPPAENSTGLWTKKGIPRTNKISMIISLILVFGIDLSIVIASPDLIEFWYMMLGVLAIFTVFFYLENFIFRKKFTNTTSPLDKWISMIIVVRNLIFILNFIPFIQLLGLALLAGFLAVIPGLFGGGGLGGGFGGIGFLVPVMIVIYIILIVNRYRETKNQ
jgi:hypothetical protein